MTRRFVTAFLSLLGLFTVVLAVSPMAVVQAGIIPCGLSQKDPAINATLDPSQGMSKCTLCHLVVGINNIIVLLRNIMAAFAIAVVVAMSFIYITSAGNESRMTFAKGGIVAALVGFIIILLAWVAVNFIFKLPIYNTGPGAVVPTGSWNKLTCTAASLSGTGACGTAAAEAGGAAVATAPTNNLCSLGTPSAVTTTPTSFTWSCQGTAGGGSALCMVPKR